MRAWILRDLGGPDSYQLEEIPEPEPGTGEVRVEVRVSALNHLDLWVARGLPKPPLPHVPGADGAGVVDAVGPEVDGIAPGDEVILNPATTCGSCVACAGSDPALCAKMRIVGEHRWGTLADYVVVPAGNVVRKPTGLSWDEAGSFGAVTGTAVRMLERARLRPGEILLVSGFGGGVGTAGLLVGIAMGAVVYVTARNPARIEQAKAMGAQDGFEATGPFADRLRSATNGRGADVIFEHLGAAVWEEALRSLARGGRLVTTGATSGGQVSIHVQSLFWRQQEIIGSTLANHRQFARAVELVGTGDVRIPVDSRFAFEEFPEALKRLQAGDVTGKVVVAHDSAARSSVASTV